MKNLKVAQKVIGTTTFAFMLLLTVIGAFVQPVSAKDGVVEIFGPIKSLPGGASFIGNWVIGSRTGKVDSSTVIKQELGPAKVGAVVEAKATPQSDGSLLATKIEVKQSTGGGGYIVIHGIINSLAGTGNFIGDWTVSNRKITVTSATLLDQTRGAFSSEPSAVCPPLRI